MPRPEAIAAGLLVCGVIVFYALGFPLYGVRGKFRHAARLLRRRSGDRKNSR